MNTLTKLLAVVALTLTLSSCGDDSNSGATAGTNTSGSFSAATNGANCVVTDSTGTTSFDTTTGATGIQAFTGTVAEGLVTMVCTGGTYTDEATGTPNVNALRLRTAAVHGSGAITIIATPASEVAFRLVENAISVSLSTTTTATVTATTAVTNQNTRVANAFGLSGVDFIGNIPSDLNSGSVSDAAAGRVAVVLAQISQLAATANSTNTPAVIITALFDDILDDGSLNTNNLSTALSNLESSNSTSTAVTNINDSASSSATSTVSDYLTTGSATNTIEAYNNGNGTTPTLTTYTSADITGVTADNRDAVNVTILAAATGEADTASEIQALIDSIPPIPALANGTSQTIFVNSTLGTITFTNNSAIASCSSTGNHLSTGLTASLSGGNCVITGTPSTTQTATVHTISGSNVSGVSTATVSITVNFRTAAPGGALSAVATGIPNQVTLSWATISGADSYTLYVTTEDLSGFRNAIPDNLSAVSATEAVTANTSLTFTLAGTQTVNYLVTAMDANGIESLTSNTPTAATAHSMEFLPALIPTGFGWIET